MKSRFDPFSHRELIKKQHLDAGDTFWSQGLRTGWYEWMILYWQNINFKLTSMWANIQLKRIQMFLKALMMGFFSKLFKRCKDIFEMGNHISMGFI